MQPERTLKVDDIALGSEAFWRLPNAQREGAFATLRELRPVSFHAETVIPPLPPGPGFWALTKYDDVLAVSRDADSFCSGRGSSIPDTPPDFNELFGSMINMDDPRHARLRRIVSRGFTPKQLAKVSHDVEAAADDAIDRIIERGSCDFVAEIAARMPLKIICDMMGIPEEHYAAVFDHTNTILGSTDPEYGGEMANAIVAAMNSAVALVEVVRELAEDRRAHPKDDLITRLITADIDGESLTEQELGSFFVLLVVAGNETTRNAISHGMKALCDYPEQRALWRSDYDNIAPTAVDEIVRWATPVIHFRRTATRDTVIRGQKIAEGDKVVLWYNSANRDEDVFPDPYRFDVRRTPNEHVGFGGPGPHFCLGANLARREISVMFRRLFERLPDLEITDEPQMLLSGFIHGIKRMPCRFTPGRKIG